MIDCCPFYSVFIDNNMLYVQSQNAHKKQASPYAPPRQQATARTMQLPNAVSGAQPVICNSNHWLMF